MKELLMFMKVHVKAPRPERVYMSQDGSFLFISTAVGVAQDVDWQKGEKALRASLGFLNLVALQNADLGDYRIVTTYPQLDEMVEDGNFILLGDL